MKRNCEAIIRRKRYPVDPYAEVYQFRDNLYSIFTESLDGAGAPWSHLIIGPEKAMLIDTSFGLGDLKGLCDEITGGMPLIVVNTHCHFDHAYGNFQFDTVYCHEKEEPLIRAKMNPHIWDYLFDENGNGIWAEFDRNDLVPFAEYQLVGVPDNYIFNLGGDYEVELMFLPGHSPGHSAYLDKKNRILFGGDQTCPAGYVGLADFSSVIAMRDQTKKIIDRLDEIDAVFPGHGPLDMDPIILTDIYEACCEAAEDPGNYDVFMERTNPDGTVVRNYGKLFDKSSIVSWRERG